MQELEKERTMKFDNKVFKAVDAQDKPNKCKDCDFYIRFSDLCYLHEWGYDSNCHATPKNDYMDLVWQKKESNE